MVDGSISAAVRTSVAHDSFRASRPAARYAFVVTVSGESIVSQRKPTPIALICIATAALRVLPVVNLEIRLAHWLTADAAVHNPPRRGRTLVECCSLSRVATSSLLRSRVSLPDLSGS